MFNVSCDCTLLFVLLESFAFHVCVEGSDINWLSFMSLIIATENTYRKMGKKGEKRGKRKKQKEETKKEEKKRGKKEEKTRKNENREREKYIEKKENR